MHACVRVCVRACVRVCVCVCVCVCVLSITDWEVIPFMYLLKLEAGDTFQTYEAVSSGTLASRFVTKADANQLSLRYLGEFVPLGFSTTAAVPVTTTPWWYG